MSTFYDGSEMTGSVQKQQRYGSPEIVLRKLYTPGISRTQGRGTGRNVIMNGASGWKWRGSLDINKTTIEGKKNDKKSKGRESTSIFHRVRNGFPLDVAPLSKCQN